MNQMTFCKSRLEVYNRSYELRKIAESAISENFKAS